MVANILIAIGFFFTGIVTGAYIVAKAADKVLKEERNKRIIVYEF